MEMSSQHDLKESHEHSSVAIRFNNKLDAISSSLPKYTIFKVHQLLRKENEMAYEPETLAIGPYHRGKPRLQVMEDLKLSWFKASLEQLGERDASKYVEAMKSLEPKARQCYSESTSHVNEDDFVEMMLLDGCFIIQYIRRWLKDDIKNCFFQGRWVIWSLIRDMMIFENQIPLFVLQELFSMIRLPGEEFTNFHDLALEFLNDVLSSMFSHTIPEKVERSRSLDDGDDDDAHHILGFLHNLLRSLAAINIDTMDGPSITETSKAKWFKFIVTRRGKDSPGEQDRMLNITSIPSAAKLHAAGVEFRSKKDGSSPFEISFHNGVMEIPTFSIHDFTESLYRNLIAYEQYSQKSIGSCVGLHVHLMDCLIDSAEDVALLRQYGIVGNDLGNDEAVSTLFNKLANNVNSDPDVHSKLFKEVNAFCGKRRHKWMAKLRSDYFSSPWALISFLAALFLLVLTLIQTVFSILGVL